MPITSARIIPFERPQSELQRAVQRRAQEHIEAQSVKPKTSKVRKLVTFAVALVPVTLIFSGFLLAVHAVRIITSLYATPETPALGCAARGGIAAGVRRSGAAGRGDPDAREVG